MPTYMSFKVSCLTHQVRNVFNASDTLQDGKPQQATMHTC